MIRIYGKGYAGQLSANFTLSEFHCHCSFASCHVTLICEELISAIQALRDIAGPLTVNSGFRCVEWNRHEGGNPNSYHCSGMAADLVPRFIKPEELKEMVLKVPRIASGGIGLYSWGCHVDVRPISSRWAGSDILGNSWLKDSSSFHE